MVRVNLFSSPRCHSSGCRRWAVWPCATLVLHRQVRESS